MRKFGMLIGIGIIFTLIFGTLKAKADYDRSQEAIVTHDGNIETVR